jgi:hypothetical protein
MARMARVAIPNYPHPGYTARLSATEDVVLVVNSKPNL